MTTSVQTCSECTAQLPANAPEGLCPRCLADMGLGLILASGLPAPGKKPEAVGQPPPRREPADLEIGNRTSQIQNTRLRYFGDYQLLEETARGGMGVVYRARQLSLNRIVAVKMLLFGKFSSDEYVRRFRAEAEAVAKLQHPNIVAIHAIGEHEGQPYFSMDYVEGQNLGELVGRTPLPPRQAAKYLQTIAEAMHYAHQHGILHRDLKPSNVLIDQNGQPRI